LHATSHIQRRWRALKMKKTILIILIGLFSHEIIAQETRNDTLINYTYVGGKTALFQYVFSNLKLESEVPHSKLTISLTFDSIGIFSNLLITDPQYFDSKAQLEMELNRVFKNAPEWTPNNVCKSREISIPMYIHTR